MERLRVGIVGGRRRRQGLGPFVARFLSQAGAEIGGLVGTRNDTLESAIADLKTRYGIEARGYLSLEALLEAESPTALAILSPAETHQGYLEAALEAGLHVLCEKPFVWGVDTPAKTSRRIVRGFRARRLKLWENCPWPYTLPAYEQLHPGALSEGARRFEMQLSPVSTGVQMLADAMPHALSLLQAIAPGGKVTLDQIRYTTRASDAREVTTAFRFLSDGREVESEVRLLRQERQPREAGYGVDGCWAKRTVRMEDYALFFGEGGRTVEVPDPLELLVTDFVRDLGDAAAGDDERRGADIIQRMQLLDQLTRAYETP